MDKTTKPKETEKKTATTASATKIERRRQDTSINENRNLIRRMMMFRAGKGKRRGTKRKEEEVQRTAVCKNMII